MKERREAKGFFILGSTTDARRYVLPAATANPTVAAFIKTSAPELLVPRKFGNADNLSDACDANRADKSAVVEAATVEAVKSMAASIETAVITAITAAITQPIHTPRVVGLQSTCRALLCVCYRELCVIARSRLLRTLSKGTRGKQR